MCDPLIGGLISGAGALIAGSQQSSQLQAVEDAQNAANAAWVAQQNQARREQVDSENRLRQQAETARQGTLAKVTPQAQQDIQTSEQQRLNSLYTAPPAAHDPSTPSSLALSGQDVTGNKLVGSDLATQVNNATKLARGRIAALATAGSYGGSFGGLGTEVPIAFAHGGQEIGEANNLRNAGLKLYGVQQQIQPVQYHVGSGTDAMGGIAKALGSVAGSLGSSGITKAMGGWAK